MGVWRGWVFPIIRMVIFAAIAAALVKVAFFPDVQQVVDPTFPTAEIVEPQVAVALGTVRNDVTLQGSVAADAAVPAKANLAGEVRKVLVTAGQWVDAGADIAIIWQEVPREDGTTRIKESKVTAPVGGALSTLAVMPGQLVSVGEDVAKIAPPTFHVSATLAPEQQYKLLTQPTEAEVTIVGGPAPFTCTGLTISSPLAGSGDQGGGTTVRCAIPADVRVFPGLSATLTIAGGIAENVLTVPTTAVEGIADTGNVYFVLADGTTETRTVTLGLNDGISVEIREGLAEGDLILQFVPGAPADPGFPGMPGFPGIPGEDCIVHPDGSMECFSVGMGG